MEQALFLLHFWLPLLSVAYTPVGGPLEMPSCGTVLSDFEWLDVEETVKAIDAGFHHVQLAMAYGPMERIREILAKTSVPRDKLFLSLKIGYLPESMDLPGILNWLIPESKRNFLPGRPVHLYQKGNEISGIKHTLNVVGLQHADLCIMHTPFTTMIETYGMMLPWFVKPWFAYYPIRFVLRTLAHFFGTTPEAAAAQRRRSWLALEEAKRQGLCRHLGVGAFPAEYMHEIDTYRTEPIAAHHNALHPLDEQTRPIMEHAKRNNVRLISFGAMYAAGDKTLLAIAERLGVTVFHVLQWWMMQHGMVFYNFDYNWTLAVPQIAEAMNPTQTLSEEDMALIDGISTRAREVFDYGVLQPPYYGRERTEL